MKKQELRDKIQEISKFNPKKLLKENFSLLKDLARNLTLAYITAMLLEFTGLFSISQYLDTGLFLVTVVALDTLALTTYAEIKEEQRITEAIFVASILLIIILTVDLVSPLSSAYLQISLVLMGAISSLYLSH